MSLTESFQRISPTAVVTSLLLHVAILLAILSQVEWSDTDKVIDLTVEQPRAQSPPTNQAESAPPPLSLPKAPDLAELLPVPKPPPPVNASDLARSHAASPPSPPQKPAAAPRLANAVPAPESTPPPVSEHELSKPKPQAQAPAQVPPQPRPQPAPPAKRATPNVDDIVAGLLPKPQPPPPVTSPEVQATPPLPALRPPQNAAPPQPPAAAAAKPPANPPGKPGPSAARQQQAAANYLEQALYHLAQRDLPRQRLDDPPGILVARLTVARDGRLLRAELAQSSGSPRLDNAMMDAIYRAAPFPAPPPELGDRYTFSMPIRFKSEDE